MGFHEPDPEGASPNGGPHSPEVQGWGWERGGVAPRGQIHAELGRGKSTEEEEMGHCPGLAAATAVLELLFWEQIFALLTSDLHEP